MGQDIRRSRAALNSGRSKVPIKHLVLLICVLLVGTRIIGIVENGTPRGLLLDEQKAVTTITTAQQEKSKKRQPRLKVRKLRKDAIFFHIGKAGGGSIRLDRLEQVWRLNVPQCHPYPCARDSNKLVLVSLRDPADRLVSAFYWSMTNACDPAGDSRIPISEPTTTMYHTHCDKSKSKQAQFQIAYYDYGKDVNNLLESLCSSDKIKSTRARKDIKKIVHLKHGIASWLDLEHVNMQNVFAIVMDRKVPDVYHQTDEFVRWMYDRTQFESADEFSRREAAVIDHDRKKAANNKKEENNNDDYTFFTSNAEPLFVHSSESYKKPPLSPENEKCLVQFYRHEYYFLANIKQIVCKSNSCTKGIESIFDRRVALLNAELIPALETE